MKSVSVTLDSLFDTLEKERSAMPQPLPYGQDCLARAAANHAQWKLNEVFRFSNLETIEVTKEDHAQAQRITKYYCNQMLIKKLRGGELTSFQKDLWGLLSGRDQPENKHLGMLYQIPFFYEEDLARDALNREFNGRVIGTGSMSQRSQKTLTPYGKIFVTRRGSNRFEYWFVDQDQQPAMLSVQHTNPLRGLIDSLHQRGEKFEWSVHTKISQDPHRPGFGYVTLVNPELVKRGAD